MKLYIGKFLQVPYNSLFHKYIQKVVLTSIQVVLSQSHDEIAELMNSVEVKNNIQLAIINFPVLNKEKMFILKKARQVIHLHHCISSYTAFRLKLDNKNDGIPSVPPVGIIIASQLDRT